ncbi:MAG: hypothetical protein INR62_09500, partial [Rhodospirillales bacterium]|nr:hypothetical protein [Acetobacter sp.]
MNTSISDASFSNLGGNAAGWTVKTDAGVTAAPTVEDATIRLEISGTSGANWHGELCYAPFPVAAGSR